MLHIWVSNLSTMEGGSRSFTGQPFKNKQRVSTIFHFLDQAGSPTGKMHGAQRAGQIQRRLEGQRSRSAGSGDLDSWSPLLSGSSPAAGLVVHRQDDDQGHCLLLLFEETVFVDKLSAP